MESDDVTVNSCSSSLEVDRHEAERVDASQLVKLPGEPETQDTMPKKIKINETAITIPEGTVADDEAPHVAPQVRTHEEDAEAYVISQYGIHADLPPTHISRQKKKLPPIGQGYRRAWITAKVQVLLNQNFYNALIFVVTIISVVGDDLVILALPKASDKPYLAISFVCWCVFVLDACLSSVAYRLGYILSIFFFLDLISTLSMIPQVIELFTGLKYELAGSLAIARVGRIAKFCARVGKITRFIKLLKNILSKKKKTQKQMEAEAQMEQVTSLSGSYMHTMTVKKVLIFVLCMFFVPLVVDMVKDTQAPIATTEFIAQYLNSTYCDTACGDSLAGFVSSYYGNELLEMVSPHGVEYPTSPELEDLRDSFVSVGLVEPSIVKFSIVSVAKVEAAMNLFAAVYVVVLLIIGNRMFIKDVHECFIVPLQGMLAQLPAGLTAGTHSHSDETEIISCLFIKLLNQEPVMKERIAGLERSVAGLRAAIQQLADDTAVNRIRKQPIEVSGEPEASAALSTIQARLGLAMQQNPLAMAMDQQGMQKEEASMLTCCIRPISWVPHSAEQVQHLLMMVVTELNDIVATFGGIIQNIGPATFMILWAGKGQSASSRRQVSLDANRRLMLFADKFQKTCANNQIFLRLELAISTNTLVYGTIHPENGRAEFHCLGFGIDKCLTAMRLTRHLGIQAVEVCSTEVEDQEFNAVPGLVMSSPSEPPLTMYDLSTSAASKFSALPRTITLKMYGQADPDTAKAPVIEDCMLEGPLTPYAPGPAVANLGSPSTQGSQKGKLKLTVVKATGLDPKRDVDTLVSLTIGSQTKKTKVKKKSLQPDWNETFWFSVSTIAIQGQVFTSDSLQLALQTDASFGAGKMLGEGLVNLNMLAKGREQVADVVIGESLRLHLVLQAVDFGKVGDAADGENAVSDMSQTYFLINHKEHVHQARRKIQSELPTGSVAEKIHRHQGLTDAEASIKGTLWDVFGSAAGLEKISINIKELPKVQFGHAMRQKYFLLDDTRVFLNAASYGATPLPVLEARRQWEQVSQKDPVLFRFKALTIRLEQARKVLAKAINADPDDLTIHVNANQAFATVLKDFAWEAGDTILMMNLDYQASHLAFQWLKDRHGVGTIEMFIQLPTTDEQVLQTLTETLELHKGHLPRLANFCHVTSASAWQFPVTEMVKICHSYGVPVSIDGAQAPGHLELSISSIGADFYVGTAHKWMYTCQGVAFLVTAPYVQSTISPLVISYFQGRSHQKEFSYQGLQDFSGWISILQAAEFVEHVCGGWPAVRAYNRQLAAQAVALLEQKWGTKPIQPQINSLPIVPLPNGQNPGKMDAAKVMAYLLIKHKITAMLVKINLAGVPTLCVRLTCQIFLEVSDFEKLANAVLELKGNYSGGNVGKEVVGFLMGFT
uniref:C2 domain-containing protein n=1 Tax=Eutreptiella gymnastica TaxID=73025 RepID=A0A7S1IC17_9EUGL|mmetsp:Transcript_145630/g.254206  ORF Transcript_145630/g.254206 Transcript_145630/m.254206 type:complete len:1400 (+) Transcript_145630:180-4379(+)